MFALQGGFTWLLFTLTLSEAGLLVPGETWVKKYNAQVLTYCD
jgi:hypothetical protein